MPWIPEPEEKPPNDRVVGVEYGVGGRAQLNEIKAIRAENDAVLALAGYYYPPGATEPVLLEE